MATTVYVKNIGANTEDKEIRDFFSFCGTITSIDITTEPASEPPTKTATVQFERQTAARTALLLNHTKLGGNEISVTGDTTSTPPPEDAAAGDQDRPPLLSQEEKPRARILAEVLAHGYLVADTGLSKALALDEQHQISSRFLTTLKNLDARTHATDHARAADQSYGLSQRAGSLLTGLGSYFEKAKDTPTGKKVVGFYETGQKQVQDIHVEARRLADLKKEEAGGSLVKGLGLDKVPLVGGALGRLEGSGSAPQQQGQGQQQAPPQQPTVAPVEKH